MTILSTIMLIMGALYVIDRTVMMRGAEDTIMKMANNQYSLAGDHKAEVRAIAGREPDSVETIQYHELEHYRFGRVLPFLESRFATVRYVEGRIAQIYQDPLTDDERAFLAKPMDLRPGGAQGFGGGTRKTQQDKAEEPKEEAEEETEAAAAGAGQ